MSVNNKIAPKLTQAVVDIALDAADKSIAADVAVITAAKTHIASDITAAAYATKIAGSAIDNIAAIVAAIDAANKKAKKEGGK